MHKAMGIFTIEYIDVLEGYGNNDCIEGIIKGKVILSKLSEYLTQMEVST